MQTDHIIPQFHSIGHQHLTYKLVELYDSTPERSITLLKRAVETGDRKTTISANIPGIGEVSDVPIIPLSPSTILIIGNTWTAIFDLYKGESDDTSD